MHGYPTLSKTSGLQPRTSIAPVPASAFVAAEHQAVMRMIKNEKVLVGESLCMGGRAAQLAIFLTPRKRRLVIAVTIGRLSDHFIHHCRHNQCNVKPLCTKRWR
jgi:hypothetical protein